jgi:FtsP/CotA-like multicopper oxidase with cupredoxin domain
MINTRLLGSGIAALLLAMMALPATAQSFRVQCPTHTALHPLINGQPNPHIKCQQLSGGDGFATMGDGTQTYLFAFGPLSGLGNMVKGLPGTVTAAEFNQSNLDPANKVDGILSAVKVGAPYEGYTFNGAIGLVPNPEPALDQTGVACTRPGVPSGCNPNFGQPICPLGIAPGGGCLDGHVDPRLIMDVGVLDGNIPAPLIAIDEGDELFLTLTNVGMVMRPDLFEQHTVHFHGYPNASAFYDGVPDASVAINIGGSFTYYYVAPEAGTYMWHCHISPPEHLQMGMVGQLYVRPKQSSLGSTAVLRTALQAANVASAGKGAGNGGATCTDILCTEQTPLPAVDTGATAGGKKYAYNDGDGSTAYDVEYPIQMHGFDPNFHFVGMTFNPESFADNKDKYFLLNGRSYPDTINPNALSTQSSDGVARISQTMRSLINIPLGGKALLRFSDLNVTEYHTLASLGIPMHVIAMNARLLRDMDGNNMYYDTNSITLAGGESIDVILDASDTTKYPRGSVFYLYTPQLDHLSNDAENFGGMMTEVRIN